MMTPPTTEMEEAGRDLATPQTNLMQLMFCKETDIAMNTKIQLYLNCFPEICCTQLFLVNMNICLCRYRDY